MDTQELTSLSIVRQLRASPERVFAAWTDPKIIAKWFFPNDGFEVPVAETDVRVGGRYRIVMKSPDGKLHDVSGAYREIVKNKRLVFSWSWASEPKEETVVTIDLRQLDGATELTLTHDRFATASSREQHLQGWTGCLANLERLCA
jgi:uncharacterized protein YndB with AHSA1/START domain